MAGTTYLLKLFKDSDRSGDYYPAVSVATLSADNEFEAADLTIVNVGDERAAFRCRVDSRRLREFEKDAKRSLGEWARKAFASADTSGDDFAFAVCDGPALVWKKAGGKLGLFRLGEIPLEPVDAAVAQRQVFDRLAAAQADKSNEIRRYMDMFDKVVEEKKAYQIRLDDLVKAKRDLESDMYSAFLPILHAKQDRIRELEARLDEGRDQVVQRQPAAVHTISSSSSDSDIGADEGDNRARQELETSQNFLNL